MTACVPGDVAFYARASTAKQLASLDAQVERLRAAAPGAAEFIDRAVSGRADERPAFEKLSASVRAGDVSEVVATKLDRLGRSAAGILEFFDLCEERHVRIRLIDQAIDTTTAIGRYVRTGLAAAAELEADFAAERTQETMDQLADGTRTTRSGRPVGRPRRVTPELADRVRQLRGEGLKWREVAVRVHLPEGTCRKVPGTLQPKKPSVENGGPDFATQSSTPSSLGTDPPERKGPV